MANIIYGMRADSEAQDAEEVLNGCVGEGWVPILLKLIDDLYALGWDGRVWQIKEKFGGLRFYAPRRLDDEQSALVDAAEELCSKTCEVCGEIGHLRQGGWVQTLCDTHAGGRPAFNTKTE